MQLNEKAQYPKQTDRQTDKNNWLDCFKYLERKNTCIEI